jgi:hypothetical protein
VNKGPKPTDWSKVTHRKCTKCGKTLGIANYYWARGAPFSWCKECEKARVRKWQKNNKEKVKQYGRTSIKRIRNQVLEAYGGKCQCCGETEPVFLVVDHINNDGAEHRKQLGSKMFYVWLRQNGFPKDNFQLLCWNCNMAKQLLGQCPHQKEK